MQTYLVKVPVSAIQPTTVEAESEEDAIERIHRGEGIWNRTFASVIFDDTAIMEVEKLPFGRG